MPTVCEICGKNRSVSKNRRNKKIPPRRRFFHPFYSVYFPAKFGDKIVKVCRTCYRGGKRLNFLLPAKSGPPLPDLATET